MRILLVDDEKEIRDLLKKYLQREQYEVDVARNGEEALQQFQQQSYQLVILDIMMPGMDGIEVCRQLRNQTHVPILMVTAKDQEVDKIVGLRIGADDYITKPFSINELIARVHAQIRRFQALANHHREPQSIRYKHLSIDIAKRLVIAHGEEKELTAKEFDLLTFLATHPEQVFTKQQLFQQVWDRDYLQDDNTVMVHIRKLRTKIEKNPAKPQWIQTVWGIGYKFVGESDETG